MSSVGKDVYKHVLSYFFDYSKNALPLFVKVIKKVDDTIAIHYNPYTAEIYGLTHSLCNLTCAGTPDQIKINVLAPNNRYDVNQENKQYLAEYFNDGSADGSCI